MKNKFNLYCTPRELALMLAALIKLREELKTAITLGEISSNLTITYEKNVETIDNILTQIDEINIKELKNES